ncbi:MAG: hypothetical protein LLG00_11425 [Planctomycetaceae bacterium]|nr:hypothetical protein [Planctomycetaceae bacterium]
MIALTADQSLSATPPADSRARVDQVRLRIAWGGGAARLWTGTIAVSDGAISEPQPLGVEADEPGSMWIQSDPHGGKLIVRQRSPRTYDGVDLLVSAPPTAKLLLRLSPADKPEPQTAVDIPLSELSNDFANKELDDRGNRVLAMRAPGDMLRVRLSRDHLVFAPGERLKFDVEPRGLPLPQGSQARLRIQLLTTTGNELWSHQQDLPSDPSATVPVELSLPPDEGVYDIALAAAIAPNWTQAVRKPLAWKRTLAQRRMQVVVLRPERMPVPHNDRALSSVIEIDPTNPRWFEKLSKVPQLQLSRAKLPRWLSRDGRSPPSGKGEMGNDCLQGRRHPLGELAELKPNADSPDVSWQAYWLPINDPGQPHVVEVEYPSDVPQTLGLSILEPDAAGAMSPITTDAGMDNPASIVAQAGSPPQWQHHRILFWPRTATPLLLVTNGRQRQPAVYGKIRVLTDGERLPRALPNRPGAGRQLIACLDRPLLADNFGARRALDPWSSRCLDDWTTFYEAGTRLVDYLHHAGCNGLMLGVLADGSTIYPSRLLEPTPRYDTGALMASAQDPVRKDVTEMLLRLFDREELQLIPMVEFASPLPELEALRRRGGPDAEGIESIGPDGTAWAASWSSRHGVAPHYNLLDPRVQQAMLNVLRELAARYASHPAFAGLAVRLSASGYAQLAGPDWGLDDATIARFERDTGFRLPGSGPQRFADRAAFLAEPSHRQSWLQWRSTRLAEFYHRAADELASVRPNSRLYLAGADMIGTLELEAELRPALPRHSTMADALLQVGIDTRHFADDRSNIVLLRPERVAPEADRESRAADLEIAQMPDVDRCFQTASSPGSFFFHEPRHVRIESFDRKCPFKSGGASFVSQPGPAGPNNRRRFVHSLASLDAQLIVDGGCVLPLGQEDSIADLVAAYRALPAVRFETIGNATSSGSQPVIFRFAVLNGRAYLYAVNDAPLPVTARVHVDAGPECRIEEISGRRKIAPLRPDGDSGLCWEVALEPYDLVAVQFSDSDVKCARPETTWPEFVEAELGSAIRRLGARAAALRTPPPLDVIANPGFERPQAADGAIPDWTATDHRGTTVQLDKNEKHAGRQSVKLASDGPVACLVSRPFVAPATGRLAISVWLRVADGSRQPPLRLALEGKLHGRDYYRFGPVGVATGPDQRTDAISSEWGEYVVQINDLPLEGLNSLRVRFDLMGPGEVWLDDVQLYGLAFNRAEMVELSKLIALADVKLQQREIGDCLHLLEGYWPRFLEENVSLPTDATPAERMATKPRDPNAKQPERTGWYNRMKDMLPEPVRF